MKIAIIGAGQQGASIARALNDSEHDIVITDTSETALKVFEKLSETEKIRKTTSTQDAVKGADIVILATPIDTFQSIIDDNKQHFKQGVIISDIGSGKVMAIERITAALPEGARYVPVHPINGKSLPGPESSDIHMYRNQTIVFVPDYADSATYKQISEIWQSMGGKITEMEAETHDMLYGTISHFEHVVAFALTVTLGDKGNPFQASEDFRQGGESLIAMTRIAGGSADMWIPVFKDNKNAVLAATNGFKEELTKLRAAMRDGSLENKIQDAHEWRKGIADHQRETVKAESSDFSLRNAFNNASGLSVVRQISVAVAIGAAITLNAKETDKKLNGVSIKNVANPSFKDGSAPMLSDPKFVSDLLQRNPEELLAQLDQFEVELDKLKSAIIEDDEQVMRSYIERANAIRSDGVRAKRDSSIEVRAEYRV